MPDGVQPSSCIVCEDQGVVPRRGWGIGPRTPPTWGSNFGPSHRHQRLFVVCVFDPLLPRTYWSELRAYWLHFEIEICISCHPGTQRQGRPLIHARSRAPWCMRRTFVIANSRRKNPQTIWPANSHRSGTLSSANGCGYVPRCVAGTATSTWAARAVSCRNSRACPAVI